MFDFIDYYKLFFNDMSNQGSLVYCLGAHKSPPFAICMWGKHLVLGAPSHLVAKVRRAVGPGWFTRVRVRCLGIGMGVARVSARIRARTVSGVTGQRAGVGRQGYLPLYHYRGGWLVSTY